MRHRSQHLMALNNLKDAGDIRAGQVIKIPGKQPADVSTQPYGTHTVQRGETLGSIAARYNTTVAELQRINSISNPNLIHPGQVIKVPGSSGGSSSSGSSSGGERIYIVRRGDTLSQIAARYGVSTAAIAQANGISDASKIYEGQRLVIP
ncbi:LysM domain-containing protein [Candidatus Amarolinea dominans]|uniref:LysM peptidoglycan-binding domain-containing protein n=1 Tax=Candidatus Amarolinea dominans TaxID=3140696 RepID=UPI0031CCB004